MAVKTIGFAVADEDRKTLDELVAYFGDGNRSAYLRATLKTMRSVMLAERLRELQAYGQQQLAQQDLALDDIPALTRRIVKGKDG